MLDPAREELERRTLRMKGRLHALSLGLVAHGEFKVVAEMQLNRTR